MFCVYYLILNLQSQSSNNSSHGTDQYPSSLTHLALLLNYSFCFSLNRMCLIFFWLLLLVILIINYFSCLRVFRIRQHFLVVRSFQPRVFCVFSAPQPQVNGYGSSLSYYFSVHSNMFHSAEQQGRLGTLTLRLKVVNTANKNKGYAHYNNSLCIRQINP